MISLPLPTCSATLLRPSPSLKAGSMSGRSMKAGLREKLSLCKGRLGNVIIHLQKILEGVTVWNFERLPE